MKPESPEALNVKSEAFAELELGIYAALETYSNVHRGSGHNSVITTHLYEQARDIILEYLDLGKAKYTVIFCTPERAEALKTQLKPKSFHSVSSQDIGLPIGIRALAVKKNALPKGAPFQSGGGTTRLISRDWVIWANIPDRFEAGTPSIINTIAFARALRIIKQYGENIFKDPSAEKLTAAGILYNDELEKYSGRELLDELRQTLIGQGVLVPTSEGLKPFINLDNSASTPTFKPIWNAFRQTWRQPEQVQQEIVREVKVICSKALGAPLTAYDVIFTSNTTEAVNLAAESFKLEPEEEQETVVLSTFLEHSSNDLPWRTASNHSLIRLQVDKEGFVDINELESLLSLYNQKGQQGKKRIKLVTVSGASNVLGVCNNINEISQTVHRFGARLFVDAAQLVAHRKIDMAECDIDYLAFSAHKVYAPFGCGVLIVRKGLLNFNSAEQELIRSSGEENTAGITALGKALVLLLRIGMDLIREEELELTGRALRGMTQIKDLRIYGIKDPESQRFASRIGVIVFDVKNILPGRLASELAVKGGIGVRYGCHCAHILIKHILNVPPFLERFQKVIQTLFPKLRFPGLTRVSIGIENSKEDIDRLVQVLGKIAGQIPYTANRRSASINIKTITLSKSDVQKQMKDFTKATALKVYSHFGADCLVE
jgi:selenocysteine lyase/cysteine desulfurase